MISRFPLTDGGWLPQPPEARLAFGIYLNSLLLPWRSCRIKTLPSPIPPYPALYFSDDSRWLVSSRESSLRLWQLSRLSENGSPLTVAHAKASDPIHAAFGADDRWLMMGGTDSGSFQLWDLKDERLKEHSLQLDGMDETWVRTSSGAKWFVLFHREFAGDTITIALARTDAADPFASRQVLGQFKSHTLSENGRWLVTRSEDRKTCQLWDLSTDDPMNVSIRLQGEEEYASGADFAANDRWLVLERLDRSLDLVDLANPTAKPRLIPGTDAVISETAISPDGKWLMVGYQDHRVCRWNLLAEAAGAADVILEGPGYWVTNFQFSPDSRWLLAKGFDSNSVWKWDLTVNDFRESVLVLNGHDSVITRGCRQNGRFLATRDADGFGRLWELSSQSSRAIPHVTRAAYPYRNQSRGKSRCFDRAR